MFGLQNRGFLPKVVEDELDALVIRIKKLFLVEHNDDGSHQGVTYNGAVTHITVVNGIVTGVS